MIGLSKNLIVNLPIRLKDNSKRSTKLSLLGTQNEDTGATFADVTSRG